MAIRPVHVLVLILLLLIVFAVLGVIAVVTALSRQGRNGSTGGAWQPAPPDPALARRFMGGPTTAPGTVIGALRGPRGAIAFEYGTSPQSASTVVSIGLPVVRPALEVRRAAPDTAAGLDMGDPAFAAAFVVESDTPAFARDVLQPETMRWLMADPRSAYYPIRLEGASALTWGLHPLDPWRATQMADYLSAFVSRIPAFVWRT
jgi:hypothetical protein